MLGKPHSCVPDFVVLDSTPVIGPRLTGSDKT
jgi:hypothetical protein